MNESPFQHLDRARATGGPAAALEQLTSTLREQRDWHNLFDARMLQKKYELGLPLSRPSSLQDVPDHLRKTVEVTYIAGAREAGEGFLSQGDLTNAWTYLQVIREPDKIARALEEFPDKIDDYELLDRLVQIALYQGVNPEKGVRLVLSNHGTCSTITALDQFASQLTARQRDECARILVRHLYEELTESVRRHVRRQFPDQAAEAALEALIDGRDWLFEGGCYHTDVSHLSSVVRIGRAIDDSAPELDLARQMAVYGSKLDRQLQYGGEPPFNDFYPAHLHYFNVLQNREREAGLQYFRDQLAAEPDERERPILAYALVDLLMRTDRLDEAVDVASQYLSNLGEDVGISFDELCARAGQWDVLKRVRQEQQNLVGYVAALIGESSVECPVSNVKDV